MKYAGEDEHDVIYAALALPVHLAGQQEEEVLARAVVSDLPEQLRVQASLAWARLLIRPGRDATLAETLDFEAEVSKIQKRAWVGLPVASLELSSVCRDSLGLERMADSICLTLSEAARLGPIGASSQLWLVMLDLAHWHHARGEEGEAKALGRLARTAPTGRRDPRVVDRFYAWRFDAEPGVPDQPAFTVPEARRHPPPIMRPLLGPERHCRCCLGPAVCKRIVGTAPHELRRSITLKSLLPGAEEAEEEAAAFNTEVRRVLANDFRIAGSLVPWNKEEQGRSDSVFLDEEECAVPGRVAAAKNIVWARRFKVRMVDAPGVNDGVAVEAQTCQDRAEGRRIKARGLPGASDVSSETETTPESSEKNDAESSDDDSDQYFRSANASCEEAASQQRSSSSRSDG